MAKLAEKHAKRIAQAFNGILVASHMLQANAEDYRKGKKDFDTFNTDRTTWQRHGEEAYRRLADEYGIEPIGYGQQFNRKR